MHVLAFGGRTAELGHPYGAHTSGDTYVHFPDADVLVTGDIVTFGRYPNIDFANGGHINEMIRATEDYIAMADEDTIIVPGHGPVGNWDTLIAYRDMLVTSRERVMELMAEGMTVDEMIAARPNRDYDEAMNVDETRIGNWIRVIRYSFDPG
jgi:glyoxylase-like metal-dependent hydrolase (beta-lactamase superfamily II)